MDKPKLLQNILNDLYHLLRYDQCTQIDQALDIVLEALTRYIKEKLIQISGRLVFINYFFMIILIYIIYLYYNS